MSDQPKPAPGSNVTERQRTIALAAVAGLLVIVLAIRFVRSSGSGASEPVGASRGGTTGAGVVPFSPVGQDAAKVAEHYKPILDADPFRQHPFSPKRTGRPGSGGGNDDTGPVSTATPSYAGGPPPGYVSLRVTGIFEEQGVVQALLENRETGKGMYVKKGDRVGQSSQSVSDIVSNSVILSRADVAPVPSAAKTDGVSPVPSGTKTDGVAAVPSGAKTGTPSLASALIQTVILGDKFDIRAEELGPKFVVLGPPQAFRDSSGALLPVLDDDSKKSVLERLRKKRQASLGVAPAEPEKPAEKPADKPADKPNK